MRTGIFVWMPLVLGIVAACSGGDGGGANQDGSTNPNGGPNGDGGPNGGPNGDGGAGDDVATVFTGGGDSGGCSGLACSQATCPSGQTTTVRGTVYDPAGKVPLYNVVVYVPNAPLDPLPSSGATCDQCGGTVSGSPIVTALTDSKGQFTLQNVPAGTNVPLVMQVGKWRRAVTIPSVAACAETVLTDHDLTRLPRNASEGSIPRIAITTGGADPLECLPRKIGLDDAEFSTQGGGGHVHLYAGGGWTDTATSTNHPASSAFAPALQGGAAFAAATSLWSTADALKAYDIVLMSCEGQLNADTKPPTARQALYDYENAGGRVFASHWQHIWFSNGPSPVPSVGSWMDVADPAGIGVVADGTVDTSFPKGMALRDWLVNVGASTTPGLLPIKESKDNLNAVDSTKAESWITMHNPNVMIDAGGGVAVEYMTFNTPIAQPASAQCGRVVYSDLHVSSGDATGQPFPSGCVTTDLSPQEKALEFMLFDLSSCVQSDTIPPVVPR